MSRFYEGDGWDSEEDEREFKRELKKAYTLARTDLAGFLVYLDVMPVKRIIADRFVAPRNGEGCAVAEFCKFKGVEQKELLKTEAESRLQRMDEGFEDEEGWGGPTVGAGMKAGLPEYVAHDLAWKNDILWDTVPTGEIRATERGGRVYVSRPMTPEERWLALRNYVAKKVGQSEHATA